VKKSLLPACLFCFCTAAFAASVITTRLDDSKAVYLDATATGDDSSGALQAAIDKAEGTGREGIVFVAAGRYMLTRTIYVWPGVRVIGYGATRPVLVLPPNTPGFQKGMGVMVMFAGLGPNSPYRAPGPIPFPPPGTVPPNSNIADANEDTFYSAMSNIDLEIGDGNPAAVGIRFHVAQHAFLTHMDFHIGSGLAGIYMVGNEAEDLHFYGGRYGMLTEKTSPAWQFTLIDSTFDGQRESAIREHEAGLTLIRDTFRDVPKAIDIDAGYPDQLWVKDCRFERIADAAVTISKEDSPLTEIGFENAVLEHVPIFARLRESGNIVAARGPMYRIDRFSYGLILPVDGGAGAMGTIDDDAPLTSMPATAQPAIPALPQSDEWINVRALGVKGDGTTDDTAALRQAIEGHSVLYFPSGHYVIRDTLTLKTDTVLIGLHPTLTQIDLLDETPGYQGVGAPKPMILAPPGGANILSGIGIFAGGINPRAVAVLWKAGEQSLIDDVRFLGGHGSGLSPYNNNHTADPNLRNRWDSQYPSLWIADGGGGTFADIWTPNTFAQAGFFVSNTETPGHVYELSNEHHVRNEIKFDHVANWDINAPQTEEEAGESPDSLSLEIDNSRNLTIANYHAYRVTRSRAPFAAAVRIYDSSEMHFRNVHVNAESGYPICDRNGCGTFLRASKFPYEDAIQDVTHHIEVREREFAALDVSGNPVRSAAHDGPAVLASAVKKLEDGFFSISGAAIDGEGKLYFVDHHNQRIYSWSAAAGLAVERDNTLDAVNLAFDKSGNLIVVSSAGAEGTVYAFKPGSAAEELTVLQPQPVQPHDGASVILPGNWWNNGEFRDQLNLDTMRFTTLQEMFAADATTPRTREYVSLDGSVVLPAGRVFQQGPANDTSGWRFGDNLDTYGFIAARPGQRVYVSSESEDITYSARVNADGTLAELKAFAQRGGESVATDSNGNVYVANGQIFVYSPEGKQIAEIDVPERPLQLVFGGADRKTLFILAHHTLFAAQVR
jgi:Pectate lyase superfamily protein/SMP-30/Gluconolactonase/LRE-like region